MFIFLFDGFSDWEIAYLTPEIKKNNAFDLVYFSKHRLFVNKTMMKGGKTALREVGAFEIEQDYNKKVKEYPTPELLTENLDSNNLMKNFNNLTASRRRSILKYFSFIKTDETLIRNIKKIIIQLTE